MKNYYRILNVAQDATDEEIKKSYRILAKRYHPDLNPGDAIAARRFADIGEAYSMIGDPEARAEYDAILNRTTEKQATIEDLRDIDSIIARRQREMEESIKQMQFKAQAQAQAQTQAQAQITAVRDRAYKEGYERGKKEGHAIADKDMMRINEDLKQLIAENEQLKRKVTQYFGDRSELEQELFDRDRDLSQARERIQDLESRLQWMVRASKGDSTAQTGGDPLQEQLQRSRDKAEALTKAQEETERPIIIRSTLSPQQQAQRTQVKAKIDALNKQIAALSAEISNIGTQAGKAKLLDENDQFLTAMGDRAENWAKKVRADKHLAKPTLYGALGVLIWATDEEIRTAYNILQTNLVDKSDEESVATLKKIREAYATLSDPVKRKAYNASIGCTEERIAKERQLIAENEKVQEEYRQKLATKEFWTRFDELSTLALAGNADAQNSLGEIYYKGENVPRDLEHAVYWFREAFNQQHPAATYHLGICYLNGEGMSRNRSIGLGFLRQAQNLGYTVNAEFGMRNS